MAFSNSYSKTDTCIFALEKQIEHERHKIREDHKEKIQELTNPNPWVVQVFF